MTTKVVCDRCPEFVQALDWFGKPTGRGGCPHSPAKNRKGSLPRVCTITVVCAWCGARIRTLDGDGQSGTSHGICPKCYAKEMRKVLA